MFIEENKALMRRIWKELLNEGAVGRSEDLVAEDYVYHGPGRHELTGREQFKKFVTWIHDVFPSVNFIVDDLIAEGDKVVSRFTMEGRHRNNKPVRFQGIVICRFVAGKEAEVWEVFDRFTIASQLAPGLAQWMLRIVEKQISQGQPKEY